MSDHFGIDISYWQVSWRAALAKLAGVEFAFIRASAYASYSDPRYPGFAQQAIQNDIPHGAYHFYTPDYSPETQAERLWTSVGQHVPPCGFMLDVETYSTVADRAQRIARFQIKLAQFSGCVARFYSNASIINSCYPYAWMRKQVVVIASYRTDAPTMPVVLSPTLWDIWQHSEKGNGPECGTGSTYVDYDVAHAIPQPLPSPYSKDEMSNLVRYVTPESVPGPSAVWCAMMNRLHASERGRV